MSIVLPVASPTMTQIALAPVITEEPAKLVEQVLAHRRPPLHALTGIRFLAASYVILFHSRMGPLLIAHGFVHAGIFFRNGYLAVTLFFLLSGFILAYNYRGRIQTWNHALRFWEARFARIWPAYIFSLLCMSIVSFSFHLPGMTSLPLALASFCMVQAWDPFNPNNAYAWNFVCWFVSVQAFLYLLFPLSQKLIERLRPAYLLLFGSGAALFCVLLDMPFHGAAMRYSGPWFYIPAPLIHLPTFLAGIALGNLLFDADNLSAWFKSLKWHGAAAIEAPEVHHGAARPGFPFFTLLGVVSSTFVLCIARGRWEVLPSPPSAFSFTAWLRNEPF